MRAVILYQSSFGPTQQIAEAISTGLSSSFDCTVCPIERSDERLLQTVDLVVIGGPTHALGRGRRRTRPSTVADPVRPPEEDLACDGRTAGPGLRGWFRSLDSFDGNAAAFDTRADLAPPWTSHTSRWIAKRLRAHGFHVVAEPKTFLERDAHLLEAEDIHAYEWGAELAARASIGRGVR